MDEQQPAAETELTTISNNNDEVADGPPSSPANNPESEMDEQPLNKSGNSICETHHHHHKWLWLHAAFHCLVTIVGTGVLGFPYATSWLGFGGGAVLITAAASSAYYTATLLSGLQGPDQKTYLDIANSCLEGGRHHRDWLIIVFQLLVMFPTSCVMILLGGEAMQTIDLMVEGAAVSYSECGGYKFDCSCEKLSKQVWTIIMGSIVLVLSMTKDMEGIWQISALGTISVFVIVGYCIIGSIIALANPEYTPGYDAMECLVPGDAYAAELLTAFGSIIFGYGFHAVVPDIQASLHSSGSTNTQKDMKKAITSAFGIALPAYLVIALLGFAAFGVNVASDMLLSMTFLVSQSAMYVVWAFVILKTGTEAVIYNQAAFTLCRGMFGITKKRYDVLLRVIWVVVATIVAIFIPFFGDLTAITGAISITPLSFLYPVFCWNRKHKDTAPKWRIWFHYAFATVWTCLGVAALIGAIWSLILKLRMDPEVQAAEP